MSLTTLVKSIQDIMRQDAGVDGDAQRISQLVWLFFMKIFDDKEYEYELEPGYESPIPERLRWRNWAADDEGITGDALLDLVNIELFPTLKELSFDPDDDPRGFIVREMFVDSYNYMKSGTLMRQVINKINQIDFNNLKSAKETIQGSARILYYFKAKKFLSRLLDRYKVDIAHLHSSIDCNNCSGFCRVRSEVLNKDRAAFQAF